AEVVLHPFAVSTVAHYDLFAVEPWPAEPQVAALLSTFLGRAVGTTGSQVRDGVEPAAIPALPSQDFLGQPAQFEPAGTFMLLSGLHQDAPAPAALAYRLASRYTKDGTDKGQPMNSSGSGVGVTDGTAGVVLARREEGS